MRPADDGEAALFREAPQRAKGVEREAFLNQACAGNENLRSRLEALLQAEERANQTEEARATISTYTKDLPASTPEATEQAGDRIGHYKLLQQIGEGGCGVVYMAEQEEPVKRRVALKVIKLGMDTKQVTRAALSTCGHQKAISYQLDERLAADRGDAYV